VGRAVRTEDDIVKPLEKDRLSMEAFFGFLKVIVICFTALVALALVLLALPRSPLRDFTLSLTKRVGATAVVAGAFLPMDVVPVFGEIGDLAVLIFLLWYWYTFFRDIRGTGSQVTRVPQSKQVSPSQVIAPRRS
jgi:hypothetical protein